MLMDFFYIFFSSHLFLIVILSEPRHEKTGQGFRPDLIQTGLCSHRKKARSLKFWI